MIAFLLFPEPFTHFLSSYVYYKRLLTNRFKHEKFTYMSCFFGAD